MTKDEVIELVRQYSNDTIFLSFIDHSHPAYVKLLAAGDKIAPFLLERLKDSIGQDRGINMDRDNCPWLTIDLLSELTNCLDTFPEQDAGNLIKLRDFILKWGEDQKLITESRLG